MKFFLKYIIITSKWSFVYSRSLFYFDTWLSNKYF